VIFVPATAPEAKIASYSLRAQVVLVEGTYDQAFDLCYEICQAEGGIAATRASTPTPTEGKKDRLL
jgi:threonine synthase